MKELASGIVPDFKFTLDPLRDSAMSIMDKERGLSVLLTVKAATIVYTGQYEDIEAALSPRKVLVASIDENGMMNALTFMLEGELTNSTINSEKLFLAFASGNKHYRVEYFLRTGEGIFSES